MSTNAIAVNAPPIIHQPCGTVARIGGGPDPFRTYVKCDKCERTVPWPNVEFQYQQTKPVGPSPNRILITVQAWYEDTPNPISTEFPIACESTSAVHALGMTITRHVRELMESLNVESA